MFGTGTIAYETGKGEIQLRENKGIYSIVSVRRKATGRREIINEIVIGPAESAAEVLLAMVDEHDEHEALLASLNGH